MKIVYISNSIIPSRTANSIHVMKMCQAFADNGHEVVLLAPNRYKEYEKGVYDIYEYYGVKNNFKIEKTLYRYWKGKNLLQIVSIYKKIKQIKPDLVFGRYLPGCFFSLGITKKVIYEAHAPYNNFGFIDKFLFKKMVKHNNFLHLVVISEALKNMYINTSIIEKGKIIVAHDASDNSDIDRTIPLQQNSKLKLGYFGHLYQGRGIDLILNLAIYFKQYDFHIVGGNNNDIIYWKERTSHIKNIIFHGFIEPKNVYLYRNSCDILLAPYQKKVGVAGNTGDTSSFMSPLKIFEYMSSKKAIICSDLPVLREILNEENSILVDCENFEEWKNAINILEDNTIRDNLSTHAYDDFLHYYTWNNRANFVIKGMAND